MAPLQKRALYEFVAAILMIAVAVPVIFYARIDAWILVALMITSVALIHWLPLYLTRPRPDQPVIVDERDRAILSNVPTYQSVGILLTATTWVFILTGLYEYEGQVPKESLLLMLCSVLVSSVISASAGVMIEYWRAKSGFVMTERWWSGILIVVVMLVVIYGSIASRNGSHQYSGSPCDIKPRFTSTYTQTNVGVPIRFIDTSVGDPTGWEWDFGDGTISREQNPTHTYSSSGKYTVQMTVYCKNGGIWETKEDYLTVLPSESP